MKTFIVDLPINARLTVEVEAESKEEAIKKAYEGNDIDISTKSENGYFIDEWDVYSKLLEGNCWYGIIYEARAEEL